MSRIEGIKGILREQIEGYRTLLSLLQQEREGLVNFNASDVEAVAKEKDTVILRLRLLEQERQRQLSAFAAETGAGRDITLLKLAEITGDDSMLDLRQSLISLLQAVSELNDFNRVLIERSSAIVKNALNFLGALGAVMPGNKSGAISREA